MLRRIAKVIEFAMTMILMRTMTPNRTYERGFYNRHQKSKKEVEEEQHFEFGKNLIARCCIGFCKLIQG